MFQIPKAFRSRGLVKSFPRARLNLWHYRSDSILVYLSQGLLSPGVICDSSLSQLGLLISLATFPSENPKKIFQKLHVYEVWLIIHDSWTVIDGFAAIWIMSFQQGFFCQVFGLLRGPLRNFFFCNCDFSPSVFEHKSDELPTFWHFCQADSIITLVLHIAALTGCFLSPLGERHCRLSTCKLLFCGPSVLQVNSENPCKLWIWPLPTAWRVWQWNLCQANNWVGRAVQWLHPLSSNCHSVAVNCKDRHVANFIPW